MPHSPTLDQATVYVADSVIRTLRQHARTFTQRENIHLQEVGVRLTETLGVIDNAEDNPEDTTVNLQIAACARVLHRHLNYYASAEIADNAEAIQLLKSALFPLLGLDANEYPTANPIYTEKLKKKVDKMMRVREFSIYPSSEPLKLIDKTLQKVMMRYYSIIHDSATLNREKCLEDVVQIITHLETYHHLDNINYVHDPALYTIICDFQGQEKQLYLEFYKKIKRTLDACCDSPKLSVFWRRGFDHQLYGLLQTISIVEGHDKLKQLRDEYFPADTAKYDDPKRAINYLMAALGNSLPAIHENFDAMTQEQKYFGLVEPGVANFHRLVQRYNFTQTLVLDAPENNGSIENVSIAVVPAEVKSYAECHKEKLRKRTKIIGYAIAFAIAASAAFFAAAGFAVMGGAILFFAAAYVANVYFYKTDISSTLDIYFVDTDKMAKLSPPRRFMLYLSTCLGFFYAICYAMIAFSPMFSAFRFLGRIGSFVLSSFLVSLSIIGDTAIMNVTLKQTFVEDFKQNFLEFLREAYKMDFSKKSKSEIATFLAKQFAIASLKIAMLSLLIGIIVATALLVSNLWICIPVCIVTGLLATALTTGAIMRDISSLLLVAYFLIAACAIITAAVFASGLSFIPAVFLPVSIVTIILISGATVLELFFNIKVYSNTAVIIRDIADWCNTKLTKFGDWLIRKANGQPEPAVDKSNVNPAVPLVAIGAAVLAAAVSGLVFLSAIGNANSAVPSYKGFKLISRFSVKFAKILAFIGYGSGSLAATWGNSVAAYRVSPPNYETPQQLQTVPTMTEKSKPSIQLASNMPIDYLSTPNHFGGPVMPSPGYHMPARHYSNGSASPAFPSHGQSSTSMQTYPQATPATGTSSGYSTPGLDEYAQPGYANGSTTAYPGYPDLTPLNTGGTRAGYPQQATRIYNGYPNLSTPMSSHTQVGYPPQAARSYSTYSTPPQYGVGTPAGYPNSGFQANRDTPRFFSPGTSPASGYPPQPGTHTPAPQYNPTRGYPNTPRYQ